MLGAQPARRLNAVEPGHFEIHQDDVRCQGRPPLDQVRAVDRLADDFDPRVFIEQPGQPGSKERLVVGDHDSGRPSCHAGPPRCGF